MTRDEFLKNTADHQLAIRLDNGVHRHLVVKKPGTSVYWYEIITWPGSLCISGDMGTNVFRRLEDMFEFFRGNEINPGYWSEKSQSDDNRNANKVFSRDMFGEWVYDQFESYCEDKDELTEDEVAELAEMLQSSLRHVTEFHDSVEMVHNFEHYIKRGLKFRFDYSDGCDPFDWSPHFLWRCYAIQHAISLYDKARG